MKISSKKIVGLVIALFFLAISGVTLLASGIEFGRFIAIVCIGLAAVITIVGALLASLGKLEKDLLD